MRISEPSFTDSGIDATGKTENQTCTRVDGRSAPSTLSFARVAAGCFSVSRTRKPRWKCVRRCRKSCICVYASQILQASATRESLPFVVRPPQKAG